MVMSLSGLNSRNQYSGLLTRRCEGLLSHLFPALCLLSFSSFSNFSFLSERFSSVIPFSVFSFGAKGNAIYFINPQWFFIGLIRKPTSFVSEASRAVQQRGK
ncbi:hypothetical protein Bresa_01339|uniref:Uncharacterized protein n=1 Tax=Brenneria salicis ATCC 15712 = DSM 30166 TaxID=714314 RepID=A0A366I5R5_9GAMM|nr:hypothetical protein [Brenneria salicis ATCC 15712 = DSM 30166]RBP62280.1 hypothetical protein DES54_11722 [Brenneria salicis ATCC 15712 = DSM 30166]